jgi:[ribosomal protein S18]-alanine N-acetyltransferase
MRVHGGEAGVTEAMTIRPMAEADVETVMAIVAALPDAPHWDAKAYAAAVARAQSRQGIALVVEGPSSRLAGFIVGGLIAPEAEIESIAVHPAMQRRGIARQLLNAFAGAARELGCSRILLEVRPSNLPARVFYAASGFAETARRPAYYANPVEDAILMSWTLD